MRRSFGAAAMFAAAAFQAVSMSEAKAATVTTTLGANDRIAVQITLAEAAERLDIMTNGSTYVGDGGGSDTFIALYAGTGPDALLIAGDDDDGIGTRSFLSFGPSGRARASFPVGFAPGFGDSTADVSFKTDPGPVSAGVYTLVVSHYFSGLPSLGSSLSEFGVPSGSYDSDLVLNFDSDVAIGIGSPYLLAVVPLPAAGGLLGAGLAAMGLSRLVRRRRDR